MGGGGEEGVRSGGVESGGGGGGGGGGRGVFFFNDTATTEIYTLSLHDALPISCFSRNLIRLRRPRNLPREVSVVRKVFYLCP